MTMGQQLPTTVCPECGHTHAIPRRLSILRRFLPGILADASDGWPCIWGGTTGARTFYRDLAAVGAIKTADRDGPHTVWALP
jgi:hypothetical protein